MAAAALKIPFQDGSYLIFDPDGYLRGYFDMPQECLVKPRPYIDHVRDDANFFSIIAQVVTVLTCAAKSGRCYRYEVDYLPLREGYSQEVVDLRLRIYPDGTFPSESLEPGLSKEPPLAELKPGTGFEVRPNGTRWAIHRTGRREVFATFESEDDAEHARASFAQREHTLGKLNSR